MTEARIQVSHPDARWFARKYAVTRTISGNTVEATFCAPISRDRSITHLEDLGSPGRSIVEGIFDAPGIEIVKIRPYDVVGMHRAPFGSWRLG